LPDVVSGVGIVSGTVDAVQIVIVRADRGVAAVDLLAVSVPEELFPTPGLCVAVVGDPV
jgi:hypothetical protein